MKKINFKQPKYIFPLVIFIPLTCMIYFITKTFGGSVDETTVATDRINSELPYANSNQLGSKLAEMQNRFDRDDAYTAIGALGDDEKDKESIERSYTEDELNEIDAVMAERLRQQKEAEELERSLAESRKHINSYSYNDYPLNSNANYSQYENPYDSYVNDMMEIQQRNYVRQKFMEKMFGENESDRNEREEKLRRDSVAKAREIEKEKNRPTLVLKSSETNSERFNSVTSDPQGQNSPLIRAMIDQTTKAHEGTRIRFKLLDDVTIKNVKLTKGTYLYGVVTGFGQQRVMAKISSVLIADKFIKVDLNVFDNDGMEGFYVPESAFRDFMKNAGANAVQQNIQFDSGYGSGISGEALALQTLQNVYNSATNAVSANIRKNKAKIKYNTIVYLINSQDAR